MQAAEHILSPTLKIELLSFYLVSFFVVVANEPNSANNFACCYIPPPAPVTKATLPQKRSWFAIACSINLSSPAGRSKPPFTFQFVGRRRGVAIATEGKGSAKINVLSARWISLPWVFSVENNCLASNKLAAS